MEDETFPVFLNEGGRAGIDSYFGVSPMEA
jgi:hypothetical protein